MAKTREKKCQCSHRKNSKRRASETFQGQLLGTSCPVVVLGGIYSGFCNTDRRAATVSVFYALFVSLFIYKTISVKELIPLCAESVKTYGGLAFVLAFATALAVS